MPKDRDTGRQGYRQTDRQTRQTDRRYADTYLDTAGYSWSCFVKWTYYWDRQDT